MRLAIILGLLLIAACSATVEPTNTAESAPEPVVEPAELGVNEIDDILSDLDNLDSELALDAELAALDADLNFG